MRKPGFPKRWLKPDQSNSGIALVPAGPSPSLSSVVTVFFLFCFFPHILIKNILSILNSCDKSFVFKNVMVPTEKQKQTKNYQDSIKNRKKEKNIEQMDLKA